MSDDDDEQELGLGDVFVEPPRPPTPEPSTAIYSRTNFSMSVDDGEDNAWKQIEIRLVGSHPLWAHHLWNAARAFATYLDCHPTLYRGKNVLELGAGGGLPGLVTVLNGAKKTILTDYPDQILLDNLLLNVAQNIPPPSRAHVDVLGYIWGKPVDKLLSAASPEEDMYDLIILSDLIFNHSQHDALLRTCSLTLRRPSSTAPGDSPSVLVFYSHHRPHLAARDLDFFKKAREEGWLCEKIVEERFDPMFPDDPGEQEVRATVHGWKLTLPHP